MRVLMLTDFMPPVRGGLETYVDTLADALCARGHEVHVATLTAQPQPRNPAVRTHTVRTTAGRFIRHADADRPFHPPVPDPSARIALRRLVDAVRPDVVHSHTWLGVSLPRMDVPVVMTAHDYALICQRRTLLRGDGAPCAGPSRACIGCGASAYGARRSLLVAGTTAVGRRLLDPDALLTLSRYVAQRLAPYVDTPVRVIPGLVPAPRPAPVDAAVGSRRYVMFAGDPGTHKGLHLLLDLWRSQRLDVDLLVATTKPVTTPLPDNVVVRRLSPQEVASAWSGAVAAVVPSLWPEPFGMVAVEAITAGTPVIASAVGALPEIVEHARNGLLVEPGDLDGLGAAIRAVAADGDLQTRLRQGAQASAGTYSPGRVAPQIEAVYEDLVAARSL